MMQPWRIWINGPHTSITLKWRHNGCDGVANHHPGDCLFNRFVQAQIKENIKAPRHWPLCGEFTGNRWIPRTDGQQRGKCFHLMTSSWRTDDITTSKLSNMCIFMGYIVRKYALLLWYTYFGTKSMYSRHSRVLCISQNIVRCNYFSLP